METGAARPPMCKNNMMKSFLTGALALMGTTAMAGDIGVFKATFDDNFLAVLRNGFQTCADSNGQAVQMKDAKNDVAAQLDQIKNFIALGVSAIVVNAVDTWANQAMTDATAAANIPLVGAVRRKRTRLGFRPGRRARLQRGRATRRERRRGWP